MIPFFKIDEKIENASDRAMLKCKNQFEKIETCLSKMADQIENVRNSYAATNTIAFARIQ